MGGGGALLFPRSLPRLAGSERKLRKEQWSKALVLLGGDARGIPCLTLQLPPSFLDGRRTQ